MSCPFVTFFDELVEEYDCPMASRHRSFLELDKSIKCMEELNSPCELWPCHLGNSKSLLEVELLADIYRIYELRGIPSVRETILDSCEVRGEIESCSILFLEDTRGDFGFFSKYYTNTSILILSCDSLLDEFCDDRLHIELKIWIVLTVRAGESESFIEALANIICCMDIEEVEFFLCLSDRDRCESLPDFYVFFVMLEFLRIG